MSWGARLAVAVVRGYQLVLRPLLPAACRFEPSCSEYARDVLVEHGLGRGPGSRSGESAAAIPSMQAAMIRRRSRGRAERGTPRLMEKRAIIAPCSWRAADCLPDAFRPGAREPPPPARSPRRRRRRPRERPNRRLWLFRRRLLPRKRRP